MNDNVVLQSVLIFALFAGGGIAGAFLTKFIVDLSNRAKEADTQVAQFRNIQTRIYQQAADSLKAMRLSTSLDLYKMNYRAFQDATMDAELVKLESSAMWRALYVRSLLPAPRTNTLPSDEQKKIMQQAEEELMAQLANVFEEQDPKKRKKKKK